MFRWLPVYNYVVMAATLLYQAPFQRVFGPWAGNLDTKVCTLLPSWLPLERLTACSVRTSATGGLTNSLANVSLKLFGEP